MKRNLHLKVCFWHQTNILSKILIKKRTADSEITRVKSICLLVTNSSFLASDKKAGFFSQIWSVHSNYIIFSETERFSMVRGSRSRVTSRENVAKVEVVDLHRQELPRRHRFLLHRLLPRWGLANGRCSRTHR